MVCAHARTHRWQVLNRWLRVGGARRRFLTFLVLSIGTIALLPLVIAKTPLRNILLSAAIPNNALRVTVRDASLSWFSGPSLSGVEVKDPAGNMLLSAERISQARGPLDLLMNRRDLGVIEIRRPTIHVQVRPDGSNLEDVVHQLLTTLATPGVEQVDGAAKQPPAYAVYLVEGTIHVEDLARGRRWRIEGVNAQYETRGATAGLVRGSLSGQMVEIGQQGAPDAPAGRFTMSILPAEASREQITFQAEALSLAALEPWLGRAAVGVELSGMLSGQGTAAWATDSPFPNGLVTSGNFAIDRLDASAAALMGDRVRLTRVELPWRLTSQPSGLAIEDLQLRSEVGQLALRGQLDPNLAAARHNLELRGAVDVARLAAMLPHALRIREGTTITSGTIELAGKYQPNGQEQRGRF